MEINRLIAYIKNNRGVTLLEVLLALAILSMVLILISNVQIFGQKQFVNQTKQIDHQSNVRLAMKVITKEIRKANDASVEDGDLIIGTDKYAHSGKAIKKNGVEIFDDISGFTPTPLQDGVSLEITSTPDAHGKKESISTIIYLRK